MDKGKIRLSRSHDNYVIPLRHKLLSKFIRKGIPPKIEQNCMKYGICPKCGGRYSFGRGYNIEPNFNNDPIYQCLDCGYSMS